MASPFYDMEYFSANQRLILLTLLDVVYTGTMSPRKRRTNRRKKNYIELRISPIYRHTQRRMAFLFSRANSIISFLYTSFRCVSDASQSEGDLEIKEK